MSATLKGSSRSFQLINKFRPDIFAISAVLSIERENNARMELEKKEMRHNKSFAA